MELQVIPQTQPPISDLLTVKAYFASVDEIHRFNIPPNIDLNKFKQQLAILYNECVDGNKPEETNLLDIFNKKMSVGEPKEGHIKPKDLVLQYEDDEQDWISARTEADWSEAIKIQLNCKNRGVNQLLRIKASLKDPSLAQPDAIHEGIPCANCDMNEIKGPRHECLHCYEYNLCGTCYKDQQEGLDVHDANHSFKTIHTPVYNTRHSLTRFSPYQRNHQKKHMHRPMKTVHYVPDEQHAVNYDRQLEDLSNMGFIDRASNLHFLKRHNGDVNRAVAAILETQQQVVPQNNVPQNESHEMTDEQVSQV
ncbi:E3 ubiquitin-protein ligase [Acrasis kona]|uniref:E3 ubiquitin-protein ligase n=1 Tax=Acrasis kona TaxID=1008807 RepID=A0AAW2Z8H4_9EUKA